MTIDKETLEKWAQFDEDIAKRSYGKRVALILTQAFNVIILNGSQDQTTSGHIAKKQYEGTSNIFLDFICLILRKIEARHCWLSRKE